MADYVENPAVYPPAIYRIALGDPVLGYTVENGNGIANFADQQLADRTAYLKAHLDALEQAPAKLAVAANLADVADKAAARTNLGLGSAAVRPASYFQVALGFTPVQQGGGANQSGTKLYIGGGTNDTKVRAQLDQQDFGNIAFEQWVLGLGYAAGIANALQLAQTAKNIADAATFASNTTMLFRNATAPTGWTRLTGFDNHAIRIMDTALGNGGTHDFSSVFAYRDTDGTALTIAQMPAHTHDVRYEEGDESGPPSYPGGAQNVDSSRTHATQSTGGGQAHSHKYDMRVKYVDFLIAKKN